MPSPNVGNWVVSRPSASCVGSNAAGELPREVDCRSGWWACPVNSHSVETFIQLQLVRAVRCALHDGLDLTSFPLPSSRGRDTRGVEPCRNLPKRHCTRRSNSVVLPHDLYSAHLRAAGALCRACSWTSEQIMQVTPKPTQLGATSLGGSKRLVGAAGDRLTLRLRDRRHEHPTFVARLHDTGTSCQHEVLRAGAHSHPGGRIQALPKRLYPGTCGPIGNEVQSIACPLMGGFQPGGFLGQNGVKRTLALVRATAIIHATQNRAFTVTRADRLSMGWK